MLWRRELTPIDDAYYRALRELHLREFGSEEYLKALKLVEQLSHMREPTSSQVSKDALLNVGANLLGILMIIKHESVNVITSKALGFITRIRM